MPEVSERILPCRSSPCFRRSSGRSASMTPVSEETDSEMQRKCRVSGHEAVRTYIRVETSEVDARKAAIRRRAQYCVPSSGNVSRCPSSRSGAPSHRLSAHEVQTQVRHESGHCGERDSVASRIPAAQCSRYLGDAGAAASPAAAVHQLPLQRTYQDH